MILCGSGHSLVGRKVSAHAAKKGIRHISVQIHHPILQVKSGDSLWTLA